MEKETYSKPIVEIEKFRVFGICTSGIDGGDGGDLDYIEEENPFG